jgi:hypothetical protein
MDICPYYINKTLVNIKREKIMFFNDDDEEKKIYRWRFEIFFFILMESISRDGCVILY